MRFERLFRGNIFIFRGEETIQFTHVLIHSVTEKSVYFEDDKEKKFFYFQGNDLTIKIESHWSFIRED